MPPTRFTGSDLVSISLASSLDKNMSSEFSVYLRLFFPASTHASARLN